MNEYFEKGYIINPDLIEFFEKFYDSKKLIRFLNSNGELFWIYNKYKNIYGYISEENMPLFLSNVLLNLPKDYIKAIQERNNSLLLFYLEKKELCLPFIDYIFNQQGHYYFPNFFLINEILGNYLLTIFKDKKNNEIFLKVIYMVSNGKLIVVHNLNIYFISVNNSVGFYTSEIMICCENKNELNKFIDEFITNHINIDIILQNSKRINNNINNIGEYKNTNNHVVIIKGNYYINKKEEIYHHPSKSQGNFSFSQINVANIQQKLKDFSLNKYDNIIKKKEQDNNNNFNIIHNDIQIIPPKPPQNLIKKEIKTILNLIIDFKKIKLPLNKNTKYEKYYLINKRWLKNYMEHFELLDLYDNQIINQTIENIINKSQDFLSNEEKIENAKLSRDFMNIINYYSSNVVSSNYLPDIPSGSAIIKINDIYFHYNYFLASENTFKSFLNFNPYHFSCFFGDDKIFIIVNRINSIEVDYFDKNKNICPEIIFHFYEKNDILNNFYLLREKGFNQYLNKYVCFVGNNSDFVSPIFDEDNKEIGYAYKYVPKIKDYSSYIINDEYKTMIKFYFNYTRMYSPTNIKKNGKYYFLINSEYINQYKDYISSNSDDSSILQPLTLKLSLTFESYDDITIKEDIYAYPSKPVHFMTETIYIEIIGKLRLHFGENTEQLIQKGCNPFQNRLIITTMGCSSLIS